MEKSLINENTQASEQDLLPEKPAARFLGISPVGLSRRRKNKEISFYKIGKRVFYSKSKHLQPFLDACERKAYDHIPEAA